MHSQVGTWNIFTYLSKYSTFGGIEANFVLLGSQPEQIDILALLFCKHVWYH